MLLITTFLLFTLCFINYGYGDSSCSSLSNDNSPFYDAASLLGKTPKQLYKSIKPIVGYIPDSISQCLGSFPGKKIMSLLAKVNPTCLDITTEIGNLKEINDIKKILKSDGDHLPKLIELFYDAPDESYNNVCKKVSDTVNPCLVGSIKPLFEEIRALSQSGCCKAMEDQSKKTIGSLPSDFILNLYEKLLNNVCGYRSPGFDSATKYQTCGYTLLHTILDSKTIMDLLSMLKLFEIPNEQGCVAYTNKSYSTTDGTRKSPMNLNAKSLDSCSVFIDDFVTMIRNMPIVQEILLFGEIRLFKLFNDGESIEWPLIVDNLVLMAKSFLKDDSPILPIINDPFMVGFAKTLLKEVHFANNFSSQCEFESKPFKFAQLTKNDKKEGKKGDDLNDQKQTPQDDNPASILKISIMTFCCVLLLNIFNLNF